MKQIVVISLALLLSALYMHSCKTKKEGTKANTPESVAERFLSHLNRLEFEEAAKYGTDNTKNMLNLLKSMVALMPEQQEPQQVSFSIDHCEVAGDVAICQYTSNGKVDKIELLKVDGVWLVNLKKESFTSPKVNINMNQDSQK
jgi:hypothetical protein